MAKNKTASKWRQRIDYAIQKQKDYDKKYGYSRTAMEYRGEYEEAMKSMGITLAGLPIVPVNEVKAFVRTFLPSVYSRDPVINVNPQGMASVKSSKVFERAINALWRELKLKAEIRRCIVDACLSPWGWIKVGYSAVFGNHDIKEGETQFESNEFIKDEEIFAVRESYKNIVYDPNAINPPYDCRWMAHRIIKPLDAVKNSKVYKNTEDLEASTITNIEYMDEAGKKRDYEDDPQAELWEIWDKDSNKVITIAQGCDEVLLEKDWPYEMDGFPFEGLTFDVNPDENYPQNFVGAWEPQLWEKIKLRSMILDHLKRFGRQMACEEGSMKPDEQTKFEQGRTGSIIQYRKGKTPPMPIQYPPIQSDMYAVMNAIESDKDNISGQAAILRGAPQKTQSRTIGEVNQIAASGEGRNADPVDQVETFSEGIAYKLKALMQQFTNLEKFVRVSGKEAEEIIDALGEDRFDGTGFKYTSEDIQGDFDIDIKAGSTMPLNRQNRIKISEQVLRNGPSMGIMPGGRVALALGRSIISDLELYEVEQAYLEEQAELEAQKQAMAQMAQATGRGVAMGAELPQIGPQRGRPPQGEQK